VAIFLAGNEEREKIVPRSVERREDLAAAAAAAAAAINGVN
jgi:hypothetical protein